jgi:hypothetical protein
LCEGVEGEEHEVPALFILGRWGGVGLSLFSLEDQIVIELVVEDEKHHREHKEEGGSSVDLYGPKKGCRVQ